MTRYFSNSVSSYSSTYSANALPLSVYACFHLFQIFVFSVQFFRSLACMPCHGKTLESHFPVFTSANVLSGNLLAFTVQRPLNGARSRLQRPTQTIASTVQRSLNGERSLLCRIVVNHCSLPCSRYESFGYIITNRTTLSLVIVLQYRPDVAKAGRA